MIAAAPVAGVRRHHATRYPTLKPEVALRRSMVTLRNLSLTIRHPGGARVATVFPGGDRQGPGASRPHHAGSAGNWPPGRQPCRRDRSTPARRPACRASAAPVTEASRHIGTIVTTASGRFQLSYCAASTKGHVPWYFGMPSGHQVRREAFAFDRGTQSREHGFESKGRLAGLIGRSRFKGKFRQASSRDGLQEELVTDL
jgi:hypothetical protein